LFRKTPLKAQNDYIFYKFGARHGPFGPPLGNFLRTALVGMVRLDEILFETLSKKWH